MDADQRSKDGSILTSEVQSPRQFCNRKRKFSSFGDDYLRLLTGLGEDGELRRNSLFTTTGHLT